MTTNAEGSDERNARWTWPTIERLAEVHGNPAVSILCRLDRCRPGNLEDPRRLNALRKRAIEALSNTHYGRLPFPVLSRVVIDDNFRDPRSRARSAADATSSCPRPRGGARPMPRNDRVLPAGDPWPGLSPCTSHPRCRRTHRIAILQSVNTKKAEAHRFVHDVHARQSRRRQRRRDRARRRARADRRARATVSRGGTAGTVALFDRVAPGPAFLGTYLRSDCPGEFIECCRESQMVVSGVDAELVVAAANVLHERVTAHDHLRGPDGLEPAHRK